MSNCECNHCKSEAKWAKYRQERGFWAVLRMDSPSDRDIILPSEAFLDISGFDGDNQYLK